jgi:hypothetical protein
MSRRAINYHNMHRLSNKDARKAEGHNMGSNPVCWRAHTYGLIKKFALSKYLRFHNKILEEYEFIEFIDTVNLFARRIMDIMAE